MDKANFFIVGAPKCGTSSMNNYLSSHPEVFMAPKEMHYFGKDLHICPRIKREEYFKHFNNVDEKIIGEASVWYLFSKEAAQEIYEFNPNAKILIMLRNPGDMLPSLYHQNIYDCNEDAKSFEEALALEAKRKTGKSIPTENSFLECLYYTQVAMYGEQVKRYLEIFPSNQVKIVCYEDFKNDTAKTFKEILSFLDIDENFKPEFRIINARKVYKNKWLHQQTKKPGSWIRTIFRSIIPLKSFRHFLMKQAQKMNTKAIEKESEKFILNDTLKKDIQGLEQLTGKNLKKWLLE